MVGRRRKTVAHCAIGAHFLLLADVDLNRPILAGGELDLEIPPSGSFAQELAILRGVIPFGKAHSDSVAGLTRGEGRSDESECGESSEHLD